MADEKWGGLWGALGGEETIAGETVAGHPEQLSIALDMLGKGFDPQNPFAGIGTALGKSQLASKAEAAGQKRSQSMFDQLMEAMTDSKKEGPSTLKTSLGEDGLIDYTVTGREPGIETPTRLPGAAKIEAETFGTSEDFEKRFGGGGGF